MREYINGIVDTTNTAVADWEPLYHPDLQEKTTEQYASSDVFVFKQPHVISVFANAPNISGIVIKVCITMDFVCVSALPIAPSFKSNPFKPKLVESVLV
eukprot:3076455-Ditylum_brightwellii.AAC.1